MSQQIETPHERAKFYSDAGLFYYQHGKLDDAERCYLKAIEAAPDYVEPRNNLGLVFQNRHDYATAMKHYRRTLEINPNYPAAYANIGTLAEEAGRFQEAQEFYKRSLALNPGQPYVWHNVAGTCRELWQFEEAYYAFDSSYELAKDDALAGGGVVYCRDVDSRTTPEQSLAEKRKWWERFHRPAREWKKGGDPNKRIKIGYVSADFFCHSVAFAFSILFYGHTRKDFEVIVYSMRAYEDSITQSLKEHCDKWHSIVGKSDNEVEAKIIEDEIDILVDLSGFTSGHRLGIFTSRPAPVACHAFGYLNGVGLPEIQNILLDETLGYDPSQYTERIWKLPCVFHYRAPDSPPLMPLPAIGHNGGITFGYLGRWAKVSDETCRVWGEIVNAVPRAVLLLKERSFFSGDNKKRALDRLGLVEDQVLFQGLTGHYIHLATHNIVDICLDPFDLNGGVSSLDALWMGCPVVTKIGTRASGRVGASLMRTIGLREFVAETAEQYKRIAIDMANEATEDLNILRTTMRKRMEQTVVGNGAKYVAHVEHCYRQMWRDYCEAPS